MQIYEYSVTDSLPVGWVHFCKS